LVDVRVLISGGGTGGHIYPALAVAQALSEIDPGGEVLYVGRKGGIEEEIASGWPVTMEGLAIRGVEEEAWRNLPLAYALPAAVMRTRGLIRRFSPDAVLGTGGYVTAPVGIAAASSRVPFFLQEQNAEPGRTTKLLARRARVVASAYDETAGHLPGTTVVRTGTPVRPEFKPPARDISALRHLVVFGGSQGAHRINLAVVESLKPVLEEHADMTVDHVCGARDHDWLHSFRSGLPADLADRYVLQPFVERIDRLLGSADLVLARAGGSGIAEMTAMGLPMILVPFPFAGEHQRHNAEPLVATGAAVMVRDQELSGAQVTSIIKSFRKPDGGARLSRMAAASRAFGRPDAARDVARLLLERAA
jgi:UDP-N-acetylglucosamine--N-acetylmuramyl-(pentapeptide) pyrophosphoryl-undecaprenol N-acetylglucosamine transferase